MSSVVKTLFGGTDRSAQKGQIAANRDSQQFIREQAGQARNDALALAPGADINRNRGFQAALDLLGQTQPQQFDAFRQGNVGAQRALLAGLPQIQNAILGQQVDLSALQPQSIGVDTGFTQQKLPDFVTTPDLLQQPVEAPAGPNDFNFSRFLAGIRGF